MIWPTELIATSKRSDFGAFTLLMLRAPESNSGFPRILTRDKPSLAVLSSEEIRVNAIAATPALKSSELKEILICSLKSF